MSDPNMIMNFANNQPSLLTNIGQGINQLVTQKRAAEAARVKKENYDGAVGAFQEDSSPENMMNIFNADPDRFEAFKTGFDAMEELERTQTVQGNVELMGLLSSGNEEKAIESAKTRAAAYRNEGDEGQAKVWDGFAEKIANGEGNQLTKYLMGVNMGAGKIGQDANQSWYDMGADERAEVASQGKIFEQALKNSFSSEEDKQAFYETAEGHNLQTVAMLAELAGVKSMGGDGMSTGEFQKAESALRKEYDTYVKPYVTIGHSVDQMENLLNTTNPTGMVDFSVIRLFNKALDPNSVVRESEAAGTAAASGLLDRVFAYTERIKEGDLLGPNARADLLAASKILRKGSEEKIAGEKDRLMNTVTAYNFAPERIFFGDEEEQVAGDETVLIESAINVVPQAGAVPQAVVTNTATPYQQHLIESNPNVDANSILGSTEEALRARFINGTKSWDAFASQGTAPNVPNVPAQTVEIPTTATPQQTVDLKKYLIASTSMSEMSNINRSSYEDLVRLYGDKVKGFFNQANFTVAEDGFEDYGD